jgi:hypothetical protein
MERRVISHSNKPKSKTRPVVIQWKNTRMVASHSLRAVSREITNISESLDYVSVNFIGTMSSGKSSTMDTLAHLIHKESKVPFLVKKFGKEELLNLQETMASLKPSNYILIFDDIAFMNASASKKQIDQIQSVMSTIRHLDGGKDVRIILFKGFQYLRSIPPFVRESQATIISSIDDNNIEAYTELLGKRSLPNLMLLKKMRIESTINGAKSTFTFPLGKRKQFKYLARQPFLPYVFSNGISTRIIVAPLRDWVDKVCNTCAPMPKSDPNADFNFNEFITDFESKFGGAANAKAIVKLQLMKQGINAYSKRVVQGCKYIDLYLENRLISLEQLANHFDLEATNAHLYSTRKPRLTDV